MFGDLKNWKKLLFLLLFGKNIDYIKIVRVRGLENLLGLYFLGLLEVMFIRIY